MSWSKWLKSVRTIRFRLTLWYAGLLSVFALLLFLCEDGLLRSQLQSRVDDDLLSDVRQFEALYDEFGLEALADEFRREGEATGIENVLLIFRSPNLRVLASSDLASWQHPDLESATIDSLAPGEARFRTLRLPRAGGGLRIVEARAADGNVLQIGRSLSSDRDLIAGYRRVFGAVVVGMLIVGIALEWVLIGRAMSGVAKVTHTATRIGNADLSSRVVVAGRGSEIEELAGAFNAMLGRIDGLVRELREVTDNIAHDLRSPLTRIRGLAETALTRTDAPGEPDELAAAVIEECDRVVQLVNTMLEITETNAGVCVLARECVDLARVLQDVHELFLPVADDRGVTFELDLPDQALRTVGDLSRLQRVMANVVDNALKYTASGGAVTLAVRAENADIVITVRDTGIGISEGDRARIFDRFFRGDASRSTPGSGLGLALADALVRAHDGHIAVSSTPGKGSRFTITLPAASART